MPEEITFSPHSAVHVHETVLKLLKDERGSLLDIGAGEGELLWKLRDYGFGRSACDINPSKFKLKDVSCEKTDLNEKLPFGDKQFDVVTCIEVLEHLRDPFNAISEISRVLKPGGTAVISTPNIMNWYSRLRFLKDGVFNDYFLDEEFSDQAKLGHIHPFYYPQLRYFLQLNGLCVRQLDADIYPGLSNMNNRKLTKSFLVYLLFHFMMRPKERALMEGNTLVMKAKKTA